jgi:hypothetical protein
VIAEVIDSRLSAVRLAATHASCDVSGLERFDNEALYGNLDWLSAHQREIEGRLFQLQPKEFAQRCFSTTLPAVTWKANTMKSRPLAITAMANGQAPTCHCAIVQSLARRGPRRLQPGRLYRTVKQGALATQSFEEAKELLRRAGANDLFALPRRRAPSR